MVRLIFLEVNGDKISLSRVDRLVDKRAEVTVIGSIGCLARGRHQKHARILVGLLIC